MAAQGVTGVISGIASGSLAMALLLSASIEALAAGECRFKPQRPPIIRNMGPCGYDPQTQSFAGDPVRQAACLLTPVLKLGKLGPPREGLPADLAYRIGRNAGLPKREAVRALLQERGLLDTFGPGLERPVAQAHNGDPLARGATYFVIHDTSAPNYLGRPFPPTINDEGGINRLANYACSNNIERAHVFISRTGAIMLAHDFTVPWRATKFEMWQDFGPALRGLFLHTERIQPRRREPGRGWANDFQAPDPGFTKAQYDALALVYTIASLRAGFWMIPAFHAVIDEGIFDKHDDPQNFELESFAFSLRDLMQQLPPQDGPVASQTLPTRPAGTPNPETSRSDAERPDRRAATDAAIATDAEAAFRGDGPRLQP